MEAIDCRALFERYDTDKNGTMSACEFLAMIEEFLIQRDRNLDPDAALSLSATLASSPFLNRGGNTRREIGYDEFAQAVRGGLLTGHFSPDLIRHIVGAAGGVVEPVSLAKSRIYTPQ